MHHDRLYYILDQEYATFNFLIENCSSEERVWMHADVLFKFNDLRFLELEPA